MFDINGGLVPLPNGGNVTIWRYVGFAQFVSLLETQCLHFSRPDQFSDPFEGTVPRRLFEKLAKKYRDSNSVLGKCPTFSHDMFAMLTCVSCWHVSDHESDAMWKLYCKSGDGIAIRSSYKRLDECFNNNRSLQIDVGMVKYINFEEENLDDEEGFSTVFIKRNHFEHERELRAIVYPVSDDDDEEIVDLDAPTGSAFPTGRDIPVNLDTLIESVYVSPFGQGTFLSLVQSVVKRYGQKFPIYHSEMAKLPPAARKV